MRPPGGAAVQKLRCCLGEAAKSAVFCTPLTASLAADSAGNRIPDFSWAGYKNGTVPIPAVPAVARLDPIPGDNTVRIQQVIDSLGRLPLVAEDLGLITPDVVELRDAFKLPGMKIMQFGFDTAKNPFLPHNYPAHCIA